MSALSLLVSAVVLLYVVAALVCWPSTGEPLWWGWLLVPLLVVAVKLWDERETVAIVAGAYGGTVLLLCLGYRFKVFLLG